MARVLEYIHELKERGFVIRVWGNAGAEFDVVTRREQWSEIQLRAREAQPTAESLAEDIATLPYCNAVEVKAANVHGGQGVLIYPDWP